MPIVYDTQAMLVQFVWETANYASGGGTTTLGIYTDASGGNALNAIVEDIRGVWLTTFQDDMDSDWTLASIRWETQTFSGEVQVGTAGGTSMTSPPPNTSILLSYKAAEKGPRNRGRSYWPGLVPEASIDERGIVTPTVVADIFTTMEAFWTGVNAIPDVLGHYIPQSEYSGQASPPNLPWPQVLTRTVSPIVATQRRRLRR